MKLFDNITQTAWVVMMFLVPSLHVIKGYVWWSLAFYCIAVFFSFYMIVGDKADKEALDEDTPNDN